MKVLFNTNRARFDFKIPVPAKYIHPDNHPATTIQEDAEHRFVTDEEKDLWNSNVSCELIFEGEKIAEIGQSVNLNSITKGNVAFIQIKAGTNYNTYVIINNTQSSFTQTLYATFFEKQISIFNGDYDPIYVKKVVVM